MNSEQNNQNLPALRATAAGQVEEIDLIELISYYLSKWYLILLGLIVGGVLAGLYTYFMIAPTYTASSKLYMVSNSSDTIVDLSDFNIGNSLSSDYQQLLKVRPILEEVIDEEDLEYTYEQLRKMVDVTTLNNTRILQISAVSTSPTEAMVIANALADKAVEEIPVLMDTATPNIAERAIVPTNKTGPSMSRNTIMGALLGAVLVAGILTVIFLMDDTVATAEELEKVIGVMPLSVIPEGDINISGGDQKDSYRRKKRRRSQ